jgi:hypothetical protein
MRRRLLLALVASAATGVIIYLLVMQVLPGMIARLTQVDIEWLRKAFTEHPLVVLGVILVFAAVLAAPVFVVFRWVYGPVRDPTV